MKDQSLLPLLDAWAKAAEMARDSVLKLKQRNKLQPATPATRLVLDFMHKALTHRLKLLQASELFNQSAMRVQMTVESHLIDKCKFPRERIFYNDLPDFAPGTFREWWNRALKPFLDKPETLHSLRCYHPSFYKELSDATSERKE